MLQVVAAYDDGRFDAVPMADVDASIMWEVYLETLAWADVARHSMLGK